MAENKGVSTFGEVDINYDLNYTNFPRTAARKSWAYPRGEGWADGTHSPDFGQGYAYINSPHYWAQYLHCIVFFGLVSSKIFCSLRSLNGIV